MALPEELVEYAEALLARNPPPNEVEIRAAVSRAYYGAYHACTEFEKALPFMGREIDRPGGVHERLVQRLGHPDVRLRADINVLSRRLSALLRQAREERERADYRLAEKFSLSQADVAVIRARRIIALVRGGLAALSIGP